MKGLMGILSTLHGKIIAGVVATSIVAGGGLVAYNVGSGSGMFAGASSQAGKASSGQHGGEVSGEAAAEAEKSGANRVKGHVGSKFARGNSPFAGTGRFGRGLIASGQVGVGARLGSSGSGSNNPSGGPSGGGGSLKLPGAPNIPGLSQPGTPVLAPPSGASLYSEGSMSVYVPAVGGQTWEVCASASGVVDRDRCVDVGVRETKPVKLTISYSGNASATAPTLTPGGCPAGQTGHSISASGLTPGASVSATAGERTVTRTVESKGQSLTASFCQKS
jgi:hypothetical protein